MSKQKPNFPKKQEQRIPSENDELVRHVVGISTDSMESPDFQMVLNSTFFLRVMAVVHAFLIKRRQVQQRKGGAKVPSIEAMWQLGFILGYLSAIHGWFPRLAEIEEFKPQIDADIKRTQPVPDMSVEAREMMDAQKLDAEDYAGAQEASIHAQFGDAVWESSGECCKTEAPCGGCPCCLDAQRQK